MTLLPIALSATLVLFFVCACPTTTAKKSAKRRVSSILRAICRAFVTSPLDDTNPR